MCFTVAEGRWVNERFNRMKQAIRAKRDLEAVDEWNKGLTAEDYAKIAPRLALTAEEVEVYAKGKGLLVLIKMHNNHLEFKEKFAAETAIAERFAKDITPPNWPWSEVEQFRDILDEALWKRRIQIINLLFEIARDELILEAAEAEEKTRIKAAPKMLQSKKRKTLAWHREQARKSLKEKKMMSQQKKKKKLVVFRKRRQQTTKLPLSQKEAQKGKRLVTLGLALRESGITLPVRPTPILREHELADRPKEWILAYNTDPNLFMDEHFTSAPLNEEQTVIGIFGRLHQTHEQAVMAIYFKHDKWTVPNIKAFLADLGYPLSLNAPAPRFEALSLGHVMEMKHYSVPLFKLMFKRKKEE